MPIYTRQCINGHQEDSIEISWTEKYTKTVFCKKCNNTMGHVFTLAKPSLFFEEGKARVIHNLGHDPVTITSSKQHEAAMKKAGVSMAVPKRGMPGCWI